MTWSTISLEERIRLLRLYEQGEPLSAIAQQRGMTTENLTRRLREFRQFQTGSLIPLPQPLRPNNRDAVAPPLTDMRWIDPDTDQGIWLERLHEARDTGSGHVRVMHLSDIHMPFEDASAMALVYQLVAGTRPDVIVVGSDAADFAMLGRFLHDPDVDEGDDILNTFAAHWQPMIARLRHAAPDATLVYIFGNHDLRILTWAMEHAAPVRHTVWSRFVEIVRAQGNVLWIGETDAVRLGPLLVLHGNVSTEHAASAMLRDNGYQLSLMAGHVHRLTQAEYTGADFSVRGVTGGCLCLPPHYQRGRRPRRAWQLGTAIAHVDLRSRHVSIDNLRFETDGDVLHTFYQQQWWSVERPRPDHKITFDAWKAQAR